MMKAIWDINSNHDVDHGRELILVSSRITADTITTELYYSHKNELLREVRKWTLHPIDRPFMKI